MEEEGNADYGGIVQPSQHHVAPCVKGVEWGLGTRGSNVKLSERLTSLCNNGGPNEDTP